MPERLPQPFPSNGSTGHDAAHMVAHIERSAALPRLVGTPGTGPAYTVRDTDTTAPHHTASPVVPYDCTRPGLSATDRAIGKARQQEVGLAHDIVRDIVRDVSEETARETIGAVGHATCAGFGEGVGSASVSVMAQGGHGLSETVANALAMRAANRHARYGSRQVTAPPVPRCKGNGKRTGRHVDRALSAISRAEQAAERYRALRVELAGLLAQASRSNRQAKKLQGPIRALRYQLSECNTL